MEISIGVGSTNLVKVNAVRNVVSSLDNLFSIDDSFIVTGHSVASGVPDQPIGLDQILEGACNRAKRVFQLASYDYGFGLEAGIYKIGDRYLDVQFCAVQDAHGYVTVGHSGGFAYPPSVIEKVFEGNEIGDIFADISGDSTIKKGLGAIGMLSKGQIDRTEFSMQSVLMAMIPRISHERY